MSLSLLLRNVLAQDGFMERGRFCDILIDEEEILSVEDAGSINIENSEIVEGAGKTAVIPGLVNAHTHAAMSLLRGLGEEKPLMNWLKESIWPVEAGLKEFHIYRGTRVALLEMISSGVTCFSDMYFEMDSVAQAAREMGVRCAISRGIIGNDDERLNDNLRLFDKWNGKDGMINVQFGPHAPYTVSLNQLKKISSLAAEKGAGVHFHFLEADWEAEYLRTEYNLDPMEYLDEAGLLDLSNLVLAHGVWVAPEMMATLSKENVTVVHCPKSNLKLGSGIQNLPAMMKNSVNIALGSDGGASNNQLNIWDEMKTAALIHKGTHRDPTVVKALDALRMATWQGSKCAGFHKCGRILPGMKADLALIDLDRPHYVGADEGNLVFYLVYAGAGYDVKSTIINGKFVYRDCKFVNVDPGEIISAAEAARNDLLGK